MTIPLSLAIRITLLSTVLFVLPPPLHGQDAAPQWYKGNLHTHSLWSDGNDFPEMICDWYVNQGYHFLGLSDHNILSTGEKWIDADASDKRGGIGGLDRYRERFGKDWVEVREVDGVPQVRLKTLAEFRPLFEKPGKFLLLQAEEITDNFQRFPIHVNANNLEEYIRPQGGGSVRETIANNLRAVQQQSLRLNRPILAHLNHPNFGYAVTAEDMAAVAEERFFEIFNGHPSVNHRGDETHVSMERMWDIANTLRIGELELPPLYGLGTDDSHNYFGQRGASTGRGWIMVRANELSPGALLAAIFAGDFYASSGVSLDSIRFDTAGNELEVRIQAEDGASYVTEFIGTMSGYDPTSSPVTDSAGNELRVTRRYSEDMGQVLATVEGPVARYQLTGKELYVRAVVTSSQDHDNPCFSEQKKQAWTQPVGWKKAASTQ